MAIYKLLLPKMGESVAEATVIKWNKNPGDHIEADDTVMEIATDKVDSDVPSPVSGRLAEQFFQVNDVVRVGSVIATIETSDNEETTPENEDAGHLLKTDNDETSPVQENVNGNSGPDKEAATQVFTHVQEPWTTPGSVEKQQIFEDQHKVLSEQVPFLPKSKQESTESYNTNGPRFYSPLVKNIAAQEGIGNEELDKIPGTGAEGRLTKDDLLAYIQNKQQSGVENIAMDSATPSPATEPQSGNAEKSLSSVVTETNEPQSVAAQTKPEEVIDSPEQEEDFKVRDTEPVSVPVTNELKPEPEIVSPPATPIFEKAAVIPENNEEKKKEAQPSAKSLSAGDETIEMDRMRRLIADHMLMSKQTAPHVTSFVEADVTNLVLWREKVKGNFEKREGQKITYMPLFIEAVVRAIKDMPMINVTVNGTQIIKKKDINISMATSLPTGNLIVPVIKRADELSLVGLTKAVNDLAGRARGNKLKPDDVQDGTFTITNIGSFGNIMGTPIINQPQVAILAVGAIKKKVAVIETPEGDLIGIRHMMYLSLSYDHRVVDGALGGSFIKRVADYLEGWDSSRSI